MSPLLTASPLRRVFVLALTLLLALVGAGLAPSAEASDTRTVTLKPDRVTHTDSSVPNSNFASSTTAYASSSMYATYIGFPALKLEPGETVTGATLKTYIPYIHGRGLTNFNVTPVENNWRTSSVTHNRKPAALGGKINTNANATVRETARFNLDSKKVGASLTSGASLRVTNDVSNSAATLHAVGSRAPELVVTITKTNTAPSVPEVVQPPATEVEQPSVGDGSKPVFAHYFPPYPISLDNRDPATDYYARHYLQASGENGKFASVGGLLRDRPLPGKVLSGNYQLENLKTEVRQAMAAGIDGFAVDILNITGANWDRTVLLMQAAEQVSSSFKIMLQPDATASAGSASAADLAAALAKLSAYSSVYKRDGRVVISPFKAENKTPAQWSEILRLMDTRHGIKTSFLPLFLDANKMDQYASISIGFGNWGTRDPQITTKGVNYAARAHALGKLWMQPVSVQDVRPNQSIYDEAGNTEQLRASWAKAIDHKADMAMLVTWNDYSEGTQFAPSANHGHTYLDISQYYLKRFKTGAFPAITTDAIHVTHRTHRHNATVPYAEPMRQRAGTNRIAARDTVEVLTFMRSSASVTVTVGSTQHTYTAPAGVSAKLFPLQDGHTAATATRSGSTVATVRTKDPVVSRVTQQDMTYHAVSSNR